MRINACFKRSRLLTDQISSLERFVASNLLLKNRGSVPASQGLATDRDYCCGQEDPAAVHNVVISKSALIPSMLPGYDKTPGTAGSNRDAQDCKHTFANQSTSCSILHYCMFVLSAMSLGQNAFAVRKLSNT